MSKFKSRRQEEDRSPLRRDPRYRSHFLGGRDHSWSAELGTPADLSSAKCRNSALQFAVIPITWCWVNVPAARNHQEWRGHGASSVIPVTAIAAIVVHHGSVFKEVCGMPSLDRRCRRRIPSPSWEEIDHWVNCHNASATIQEWYERVEQFLSNRRLVRT